MLRIPWASVDAHMGCKGSLVHRASVTILEVVDHFLDPHHARARQPIRLHERLPDLAIGSRIDIDREGRQRCLLRFEKRSFYDLFESVRPRSFGRGDSKEMGGVCTQFIWKSLKRKRVRVTCAFVVESERCAQSE